MTAGVVDVCAALGDATRWDVLTEVGRGEASASALAERLPVTRQAIAKHLAVLAEVGLVEPVRVGREVRYRAVGERLTLLARTLEAVGARWDERLATIRELAQDPDA